MGSNFLPLTWPYLPVGWALALTVAFAAIGYGLRGVTLSGAAAGAVAAFALLYFGGPGAFAALVAVFVITWIGTRLGYRRKQRLGIAESRRGRNAGQVFANLSIAAVCAVIARVVPFEAAMAAAVAALAEAAADTTASECGEAWSDAAYLITSLRAVPPGTDGAISLPGTIAAACAAGLIAATAGAMHLVVPAAAMVAAVAGFAGSLVDSVLGATLERRGWMRNNGVNFLSTLAAAFIALGLVLLVRLSS